MATRRKLGPDPLPLPTTLSEKLPSVTLGRGSRWWRTQPMANGNPIYFGDPKKRINRFDLSRTVCAKSAGCLYVSQSREGAFIEVFGSITGTRTVTEDRLRSRGLFAIEATRDCTLVSLTGKNLAHLGLDARIWSGDIAVSQKWATAFYSHPLRYDGICYPCRHDNDELAIALFDRMKPCLISFPPVSWYDSPSLAQILEHYDFGLVSSP